MAGGRLYGFGPFYLDPAERHLYRQGQIVPLTPKAVDTLLYLVERHEHTVEKEDLIQKVWPETFVEDGSLTQIIWMLRKTLGDSAESHEYIATVPKRGYRFVAPVREIPETARAPGLTAEAPRASPSEASTPTRLWRRRLVWMAPLTVVALSVAAYFIWQHFLPHRTMASRRVMLAVLPVQNLSGDPKREYISDGLTEEMIAQIGNLSPQRLGVIARTSSMAYKKTTTTVDQIARELKVDYVLETSLRESGNRVRVTTQLIRTSDQTHLWAHDYDRVLGDIMTLQGEVAYAVAAEIELRLAPEAEAQLSRVRQVDPAAYQAYLRGRSDWNRRTEEGLRNAIEQFETAIAKEPHYAAAYAGLADSYVLLGSISYGGEPPGEAMGKAREYALTALKMDDSTFEAHAALGWVLWNYDWNWPEAEREFLRAIELHPNSATSHHWYALFLSSQQRHPQAIAEIGRALELDPLSPIVNTAAGTIYYNARHYDRSLESCRNALALDPQFVRARLWLAMALQEKSMAQEAVEELRKSPGTSLETPRLLAELGHAFAVAGDQAAAEGVLRELQELARHRYVSPYYFAVVYAGLGKADETFAYLERAFQEHSSALTFLAAGATFDRVRADPRFQELIRRMGLPR